MRFSLLDATIPGQTWICTPAQHVCKINRTFTGDLETSRIFGTPPFFVHPIDGLKNFGEPAPLTLLSADSKYRAFYTEVALFAAAVRY